MCMNFSLLLFLQVYAKAKELPKTESELGAKLRSTWNGAIFSVKDSISSLIADAKKK